LRKGILTLRRHKTDGPVHQ